MGPGCSRVRPVAGHLLVLVPNERRSRPSRPRVQTNPLLGTAHITTADQSPSTRTEPAICVDRRQAAPCWSASGPAVPLWFGLYPRTSHWHSLQLHTNSAVRIYCVWPSEGYCRVKARYGAAGRSFCGSAGRSRSALRYASASTTSPWSRPSPHRKSPRTRGIAERPPPRRRGSKGPSNPAAVPWTPESSAADDQEAKGGEGDGNR